MECTTNQTEEEEPTVESEVPSFPEVDASVFEYEQQDDGTVFITGLNEDLEAVVIPSVIDGMKVTGIEGYWKIFLILGKKKSILLIYQFVKETMLWKNEW